MPDENEDDLMDFIVLISFNIRAFDDEEAKQYANKICDHYPGYEPTIESIDESDDNA